MTISRIILILGDQLDLNNAALKSFNAGADEIIMIESIQEAKHVWSHKARIAIFLSAMRHFAKKLKSLKYPVIYVEQSPKSIVDTLREYILAKKIKSICCVEPGEWRLRSELEKLTTELNINLEIKEDTHFYCSPSEFAEWASGKKELRLEYFYRLMRKKHSILIDEEGGPVGGQWNFDQDNRKPYPKKGPGLIDEPLFFEPDSITQEVIKFVNATYSDHPGELTEFKWPVCRENALQALDYFVEYRLRNFGTFQDAMWTNTPFGWHSILSSSLNLKLLNPREVIAAVVHAWQKYELPLSDVEGFVRQILGWREFVRGMYYLDMPKMATDNYYEHKRALPKWYWSGQTEMLCMQDAIGQTLKYGYAHHIQRLMLTGNFALLAEILPTDVCDWYLAVYIDAIEWVELPNTAGMALFANGGRFTSKPYIASGAYVKRMSNYCDTCRYQPQERFGEQACPITVLYWNFLIKHRKQLESNSRTRLMTANLSKIDADAQVQIVNWANRLLNKLDNL